VLRLLDGIGVDLPEGFAVEAPGMKRQADELSEEWISLYSEQKFASPAGKR
jgi:LPS sulfotransferase NodH